MYKVSRLESALEIILFYCPILQAKGVGKKIHEVLQTVLKYWIPIIWTKWEPKSGLPLNPVPVQ